MEMILPGLVQILPMMPLFIMVLSAIIYAGSKQAEVGRPARLVLIGGILVLVSLLINMITNISVFGLTRNYDAQAIGLIFGISGFVTMVISTIGWGMILYAVFVDRKTSEKLDF